MFDKYYDNNVLKLIAAAFLVPLLIALPAAVLGNSLNYSFGNGIEARIYTPEAITGNLLRRGNGGELIMEVERGWEYELIEDPSDSAIAFSGDGEFHPYRLDHVIDALEAVDVNGNSVDIQISVYLLPFPRRGITGSSASGYRIFLSPFVSEPERDASSYTVTHELGHCVQNRFIPTSRIDAWRIYLDIRGMPGMEYIDFASPVHAENPLEIFAEDFRYLFGGESSSYPDCVENTSLRRPDEVPGLEEFFCCLISGTGFPSEGLQLAGDVTASNFPNPFNPSTTIRVDLGSGTGVPDRIVNVSVFDVSGRLVDEIYNGRPGSRYLSADWNGRDMNGNPVSSGVYLYVAKSGDVSAGGKMLLLR